MNMLIELLTEGKVMGNPGGVVHEVLNSAHEIEDLTLVTLLAAAKVL